MNKLARFIGHFLRTTSFHVAIKTLVYGIFLYGVVLLVRTYIPFQVASILLQLVIWYIIISTGFALLRSILLTAYRVKHNFELTHYDNYTAAIINLLAIIKVFVLFTAILYTFNLEITQFLTSISIFAVALVLIFREYITNTINGLFLLFSPIYKIGNYIQIGETRGKIKDINFMYVTIRDEKNQKINIPNSVLLTKEVIDITHSREKIITLPIECKSEVSYPKLIAALKKQIPSLQKKYTTLKSIDTGVSEIGKDTYKIEVTISLSSYTLAKEREIKRDLYAIILALL